MTKPNEASSPWMGTVLRWAALYNITWGAWTVLFPSALWSLADLPQPNYPELWQCIGMIVGCYGVAYWVAAGDAVRHWPVVLAGLLGKVLGPIGFLQAAIEHRLPWKFGIVNIGNDLIWWIPFGLILWAAHNANLNRRITTSPDIQRLSMRAKSQFGVTLLEMSEEAPTLVVFLRHFGCTFCREAVDDLAKQRIAIGRTGTQLALVHMGAEAQAAEFFEKYGLEDVPRISDPPATLYRAFGLNRGSMKALFGPKVWTRGMQAGVLAGHGVGSEVGDGYQMPGVFLVFHGEILRTYRHHSAADRPDYVSLTTPQPIA